MFIEGEPVIDSILRLLWPSASAEPGPRSPEGENESEMEQTRERGCKSPAFVPR